MEFEKLEIEDVVKITPRTLKDSRGVFMEKFKTSTFNKFIGREVLFVQDNQSFSISKNTLRGLHIQSPPYAQGKLVSCAVGSILDVAVDVRKSSPTYGKYVSTILSAKNNSQLWVPEGFLHGFLTLEEDCIVQYKCTNYYSPECDFNVAWNDPNLSIDWDVNVSSVLLSEKDLNAPKFKDYESPFV